MKEIEVKARIDDLDEIKGKLEELGCIFSKMVVQKDTIYLPKPMTLKDIKRGSSTLRIRDSNGKYILTMKKQLENELDNIEIEVVIDDAVKMDSMLKELGWHVVANVEKKRIKTNYKGMEICIDEVKGLGNFIEVEKLTNDRDSLKVQEELFEFLKSIGAKERVFKGYDTMMDELK